MRVEVGMFGNSGQGSFVKNQPIFTLSIPMLCAMYLIYIFYLHLELFRFVSEGTPIIRTLEDDKLKVSVPG